MADAATSKKRACPVVMPQAPAPAPLSSLSADARARIVACLSLGALVRLGQDIAAAFLQDDDDEVWRLLAQQQWPVLRRLRREGDWGDWPAGRAVAWVEDQPISGSPPLCLPSACTWQDVYCAVALALKSWRAPICYSDSLDPPGHLHAGEQAWSQALFCRTLTSSGGCTHEELRSEHDPRVILSPHRLVEALAYAYVAEHTRIFSRLRGGVGRVCAVVSLQQALARWLAGVLEVSLPFPRSLAPASFYYTLRMALDCPFLASLPPPPDATAPAGPAITARADAEENSLIAFVSQHLKAAAFAHIYGAVTPESDKPEPPIATSTAAFLAAVTVVIQRRREGWGPAPTCRAVAAAFVTILQAFPYASGVECWVRWHLGRGEPHLAEVVVRCMWDEKPVGWGDWDGWPWPNKRLVADMDNLPSAGPVSLTPRGRLTSEQLCPSGATDEDQRCLSEDEVEAVGGDEEEWRGACLRLWRELWEQPGATTPAPDTDMDPDEWEEPNDEDEELEETWEEALAPGWYSEEYLAAFERKWLEKRGLSTEEEREEQPQPQPQPLVPPPQQAGGESDWFGGGSKEEEGNESEWWDGSSQLQQPPPQSRQSPIAPTLTSTPATAPAVPQARSSGDGWRERLFGSALGFFPRRRRRGTEAQATLLLQPPITARQQLLQQRQEEDEAVAAVAAAEQEDMVQAVQAGAADEGMELVEGLTTPRSEASAAHSERMQEERDVTEAVFSALRRADGEDGEMIDAAVATPQSRFSEALDDVRRKEEAEAPETLQAVMEVDEQQEEMPPWETAASNSKTDNAVAGPPPLPLRPIQQPRQHPQMSSFFTCVSPADARLAALAALPPPSLPPPSLPPPSLPPPSPMFTTSTEPSTEPQCWPQPRRRLRYRYHAGKSRQPRPDCAFPSCYDWGWWEKPLTHTDPDRIRRGLQASAAALRAYLTRGAN